MSPMCTEHELQRLARALAQRYAAYNVSVQAARIEHAPPLDGVSRPFSGWRLCFSSDGAENLIRAGLATRAEVEAAEVAPDWPLQRWPKDEHGSIRDVSCGPGVNGAYVAILVYDELPERDERERRINTKKMQRAVARLLKRAFALPRRVTP